MIRSIGRCLAVAALIAWAVLLRPVSLGGPASFVLVSGSSMEPALHDGDLVIAHRAAEYAVGDVIAFRAGGGTVIHRIVTVDAADGYTVRGDNRTTDDRWRPTASAILGRAWLRVPSVAGIVRPLAQPPVPALLAAGVTFALAMGGTIRLGRRAAAGMS